MLPKKNRVKKKKDFKRIFKESKNKKNNIFVLKIAKNNLNINRFGFVVSQKVSKKATIRNKVRRRLAGALRDERKNIKKGIDMVFIALPGIEKKSFCEIKKAIKEELIYV